MKPKYKIGDVLKVTPKVTRYDKDSDYENSDYTTQVVIGVVVYPERVYYETTVDSIRSEDGDYIKKIGEVGNITLFNKKQETSSSGGGDQGWD